MTWETKAQRHLAAEENVRMGQVWVITDCVLKINHLYFNIMVFGIQYC